MKVKFVSRPGDEQKVCTMFGRDFFLNIETDVSDLDDFSRRKLAGNHHFVVTEQDAERRKPGRPRKVETETDAEDEAAA